MDAQLIRSVNREIYRQFPEMRGKKPRVQCRRSNKAGGENHPKTYLLTYQNQVAISLDRVLPRFVRVVVSEQGKILKITTSH